MMKPEYATLDELRAWADGVMMRDPDFVIGPAEAPYLRRWWIVPRNEHQNVYLYEILRSDEDRAGHDHPWKNTSLIIDGSYTEITYNTLAPWRELHRSLRTAGDIVEREATDTHRLVIPAGGRAVSLFVTGGKERDWGFWCPGRSSKDGRWVPWQEFTAGTQGQLVGKGCGE